MKLKKRAVFFDFGDTLAQTSPTYFDRLNSSLRTLGLDISDEDFEREYIASDFNIYQRYKSSGRVSTNEYGEWLFSGLFASLKILGHWATLLDKLHHPMGEMKYYRKLMPGAEDVLKTLKDRGFILAVISNNDGRTAKKCEELGIDKYFDFIGDSTELGMIKPDSKIFHYTLEKLGLKREEAVHVGDLWGADILGATNAGLDAIWFNWRNTNTHDTSGVIEIKDIREIPEIV